MSNVVIFLEPKGTILEVIRAAKRCGLIVVAAVSDQTLLDGAPEPYQSAVSCIDHIVRVESWSDTNTVTHILNKVVSIGRVVGVYSGLDPCAVVCAKLRQACNLPTTSPENLEVILNKHLLRSRLREHRLSQLKTTSQSEAETWAAWEFGGSAYFKPVHGAFSAYVKKCSTWEEFQLAKKEWERGNDSDPLYVRNYLRSTNEYHLEEAFEGELLSVEGITSNGELCSLGITSRILYSKNPVVEMGSCFPYPHRFAEKIVATVKKAHATLGFVEGPSHTEVIVNDSGEVEIIDFNPRFIGADVLQSINNAYEIKIEEFLLDWACGNFSSINLKQTQYSCLQYVLSPQAVDFQSISLPEFPEVKFKTTFIKPGTKLASIERQLDYIGCYLTVMSTFEGAVQRSRELRSGIKINRQLEGAY